MLFRPQLFVVVTFASMLLVSWRRWTSLIVDIGRETDLPLRILNGEMLYRDIHHIYSPFSPYFNAYLYRLFGVHLDTLILSGVVFSIILACLCYKICRRLMPATESAVATSFVIVMCIFKPAGNLILPYSFAGLHGAVFSLITVLFTLRYAERGNNRDLITAGLFIGLAAITKLEFAFAAAVAVSVYLIYIYRADFRKLLPGLAYAAVPAVAVAAPVYAVLFANIDWRILINDCHLFYTNLPESVIIYNRFRSGLDDPISSVIQMIGAAAVSACFVLLIILFSDRTGKLRRKVIFYFIISSIIASAVLYGFIDQWDGSPLRALPLFLLAIIIIEWRRKSRSRNADTASSGIVLQDGALLIVAVYSLAVLARVVFRVPSGGFSGSFYLPTSIILIFYAILRVLPPIVRKWTEDERSFKTVTRVTLAFCVIAVVAPAMSFTYRFREKYSHEIVTRRGTLFADKNSGPAIAAAMKFIELNTAEDEFIAVLPEGNDLAFLTGRRISFRHQVLIPGFLSEQDEIDAIATLERDNVRFIFVPNRAMREFGAVEFGRDYNRILGRHIEDNYQVVEIFGLSGDQRPVVGRPPFFIKAYRKKGS